MTSDRPFFHVILFAMEPPLAIVLSMSYPNCYSRHQLDFGRQCLWEHCGKIYLKNFATSPCYHVVILSQNRTRQNQQIHIR